MYKKTAEITGPCDPCSFRRSSITVIFFSHLKRSHYQPALLCSKCISTMQAINTDTIPHRWTRPFPDLPDSDEFYI